MGKGKQKTMNTTLEDTVIFKCVMEGRRLRVKIITQGYNKEANCQFPRAIRRYGGLYEAPRSAVSFGAGPRGKFFYRVNARLVKVLEGPESTEVIEAKVNKIYEDEENTDCVICLTNPHELVYVPCGHFCSCVTCHSRMWGMDKRVCPLCRANITLAVTRDQIQT